VGYELGERGIQVIRVSSGCHVAGAVVGQVVCTIQSVGQ
jgi:hypothetical protein